MDCQGLIAFARCISVLNEDRLNNLCNLASWVRQRKVEGDIVECGVLRGGSASLLGGMIADQPERKLWLYDTFDKLPMPRQPVDGPAAVGGTQVGNVDDIQKLLDQVGLPRDRVMFRKGLYKNTVHACPPGKIAILHLDCDWYDSVTDCLRAFYPRVSEGGFVVLDDFGYFEGCREAFYDYCRDFNLRPLLERCGYTQAWWQKGATNSRHLEPR